MPSSTSGLAFHPSANPTEVNWATRRTEKQRRLKLVEKWLGNHILPAERIVDALQFLVQPHDRVVIEGDNQKQADFLSRALVRVDPKIVHDLHMIISSISRPEHLGLFEEGIARKVDFAFAGPQSLRVAQLLEDGQLEIGAIHTYVELYARLFVDLAPPSKVMLRGIFIPAQTRKIRPLLSRLQLSMTAL
jgi:malonate decarboxylase alpha subunit